MKRFDRFILGFLGSGSFPVASGTVSSAFACAMAFGLSLLVGTLILQVVLLVLTLAGTLYISYRALRYKTELWSDPPSVTLDEACGMWLSLLGHRVSEPWLLATAFVLFRFFDILKPLPIRRVEKLRGFGVVADDLLAGVFANILLFAIFRGAK